MGSAVVWQYAAEQQESSVTAWRLPDNNTPFCPNVWSVGFSREVKWTNMTNNCRKKTPLGMAFSTVFSLHTQYHFHPRNLSLNSNSHPKTKLQSCSLGVQSFFVPSMDFHSQYKTVQKGWQKDTARYIQHLKQRINIGLLAESQLLTIPLSTPAIWP